MHETQLHVTVSKSDETGYFDVTFGGFSYSATANFTVTLGGVSLL